MQTSPWGHTPECETPVIYPDLCRETFEGMVHGSKVYFTRVGLKGPTLLSFAVIKKKGINQESNHSISVVYIFDT